MTATTVSPAPVTSVALTAPTRQPPVLPNLLRSEWAKVRSVRSTYWSLAAAAVVMIGYGAINSAPHAGAGHGSSDPILTSLSGVLLAQLAIGVLGVLVITTEYSTGVIRASLLAVPRRLKMLTAKSLVFAGLLIVVAEVVVFGSFFIGAAILHSHVPVSLGDHNVTRALVGSGLYLTVLGLFSLAIGAIIRHTAGAITTAIGVVFVLPILSGLLPGSWGAHVNGYLPVQAGELIGQQHPPAGGDVLSAWQGFGVFCLWTAVLLVIAGYLLQRRDA